MRSVSSLNSYFLTRNHPARLQTTFDFLLVSDFESRYFIWREESAFAWSSLSDFTGGTVREYLFFTMGGGEIHPFVDEIGPNVD